MNEMDPIVGNWYKDLETQSEFEIVAVDEDAQAVEIQYFEGEVEELDWDTWREMVLMPIDPPEDWSGPFDDLEQDDLGYTDMPIVNSKENPLNELD